ncbi:protein TolR [Sulfurimicrobium lacus]|uniref:Protein TolR n=1 Tax=Sulfurimicrobium lacus TaxID=2715678 RepID=A0A6F8V917_9PROT|nr:protein TolR [Sulfurimicrobium lacus]BCB25810.1 protein TolR [Sulfurimicrobium lacus]
MSLRRPRKLMNQINVVPYIDVMLVLLIIFMITAPLVNPGQIDLPQVGQSLKPPVAPLQITIKADKRLLLRDLDKGQKDQEVSREELVQAVKDKQENNPEQSVVIAGDKNVRYEEVLSVMDILQQNQVRKIGLLAKPKGQ